MLLPPGQCARPLSPAVFLMAQKHTASADFQLSSWFLPAPGNNAGENPGSSHSPVPCSPVPGTLCISTYLHLPDIFLVGLLDTRPSHVPRSQLIHSHNLHDHTCSCTDSGTPQMEPRWGTQSKSGLQCSADLRAYYTQFWALASPAVRWENKVTGT